MVYFINDVVFVAIDIGKMKILRRNFLVERENFFSS